jgi:hypothetical protein
LEKEVKRVGEQSENRTRDVRIVSANGRFAARIQFDRFSSFEIGSHASESLQDAFTGLTERYYQAPKPLICNGGRDRD